MENESEEKQLRGFEDLGEISINCENCGAPLVYIQKVKKSPKQTTIEASCPHCGGSANEVTVFGEIFLGQTEFTEHEIETEIADGKVTNQQSLKVFIHGRKGVQVYDSGR